MVGNSCANCCQNTRNDPEKVIVNAKRTGNLGKNQDMPNGRIQNNQNTKKNARESWKLVITQSPE